MNVCIILIALTGQLAGPGAINSTGGHSPATELRAAAADLRTVPPPLRREMRYLSLYHLDPADWPQAAAVVSLVLNSLSRSSAIVRPQPVGGGQLLRWSLADYELPGDVYEALAGEDPYWHLRTKVVDPQNGKTREVYTDGGWVDLQAAAALRAASGSGGALLRADFFIARTTTTLDGGYYYRLAGVPETEKEFFELLGLDLAAIDRLQADAGANLIYSGVTRKLRRVARRQGPLGGAWQTFDVERNTADRDPIRNPFGFVYEAGEHIAVKPNRLFLFALYDRQGRRQDSVPDRIAKDDSDPAGDGIIVPMLSCVRCHVEDGLRPFANDQQRLLAGAVELYADQPRRARRLAAFYDADLEKPLSRDREDYAQAVASATGQLAGPGAMNPTGQLAGPGAVNTTGGLKPSAVAGALGRMVYDYANALVTPDQAARELGIPAGELKTRLAASLDPVLLALCEGMAVQRGQWEAAFAEAALLGHRETMAEITPDKKGIR